jgi:GntR family transcriptional regulator
MADSESRAQSDSPPAQVVRTSPMPAWAQVAQHFKRTIDDGTLPSGHRLPSETELADDFGVSRMTVRQAFGHLSAEGYVNRRQGIGTFVALRRLPIQHDLSMNDPWRDRLSLQGYKPVSEVIEFGLREALPSEPKTRLSDLEVEPPFAYFKRLHRVDDEPIGVTESWVPISVVPGLANQQLVEGSLSRTLSERYGIESSLLDNVVEAVLATAADAQLLETFVDTPLFVVTAAGRRRDGELVHVSRTAWVAGRVRFHYLHRDSRRTPKR